MNGPEHGQQKARTDRTLDNYSPIRKGNEDFFNFLDRAERAGITIEKPSRDVFDLLDKTGVIKSCLEVLKVPALDYEIEKVKIRKSPLEALREQLCKGFEDTVSKFSLGSSSEETLQIGIEGKQAGNPYKIRASLTYDRKKKRWNASLGKLNQSPAKDSLKNCLQSKGSPQNCSAFIRNLNVFNDPQSVLKVTFVFDK